MWKVYDERPAEYDDWYDRHPESYEKELAMFSFDPPRPCLEVGVGTGRFAGPLGWEFGLDPAVNALKVAASRGVATVRGIAEGLPFADASFGTVAFITSLGVLSNAESAFCEARRVLKASGELIITTVHAETPLGRRYIGRKEEGFHSGFRFYTRVEVLDLVTSAGFRLIDERCAGLDPPDIFTLRFHVDTTTIE